MPSITKRPGGSIVVTVRLTLLPGRDDALIERIEQTPCGQLAFVIRSMMVNGISQANTAQVVEEELDLGGLGLDL